MNAGKTFLCKEIILKLDLISYSENPYNKAEILLISKSEETKNILNEICLNKKYKFTSWNIIHDMNKIFYKTEKSKQIIVIFEDMTQFINSADRKTNSEMIDFLYRSRHSNISILMIMHGIRHSLSNRNSFERTFLDNCSGFFIFKPINII